jgi:TolB-like protein/class 3 adenylate cyclase/lipoprotein NlpI
VHADVVGFSRLMGEDEAGTHRTLGELRRALDPLIAAHRGRIVGTAGDSLLADFPSVVDALGCAVAMQHAARGVNDPLPPERRLELRIGVKLGDVIADGDDILGDGVNIAARLQALAQLGTVCISQTVYDQVRNKLDLDYRPLGSHRVKNIAEPVRAYAVGTPAAVPRSRGRRPLFLASASVIALLAIAGLAAWALRIGLFGPGAVPGPREAAGLVAPANLAGRPSVAVLPFKNLSSDAGQAFFSDGITEDVITALGRFSNLLVVAKSASFQFRDRNLPPAETGRLLDARYLLEGSVQRAGDRVRVTVQLTEAATGRNLWSQAYDAELKDIFAVQDDVARRVVGAAAVTLTRFERDRALARPPGSLAAYEYVLRGRGYFSHATRDGNDQAQDMFRRAIDLDPSYAAAYAELGLSLIEAVTSGWTEFVADDLDRAEKLGLKALALDPASTTAYRLLAEVHMNRGHFDLAIGQVDRALEINPSDVDSSLLRGDILAFAGRAAEAVPWLEGALRLDPANARHALHLGLAYYFLGRYRDAVAALDRALAGNLGRNTQTIGRPVLAAAYAEMDRPEDAARERAIRHPGGARPHARRAPKGRVSLIPGRWTRTRRGSGGDFFELVQHAQPLRRRALGIARPGPPGQLSDEDAALAIDRDPVGRSEMAGFEPGMHTAEPRQYLTLVAVDADPRTDVRPVAIDLARRSALTDVNQRVAPGRHAHAVRPVQIVPLGLEPAVAGEDLYPVVFAVGDIDPAVGVAADVVRHVELAGVGAGLAPCKQQSAVRRVFVDAGVAVAVRDIDLALRRQRGMGAAVKRLAAHIGLGRARDAQGHQHPAVECAMPDRVVAVVGQPDRVVRREMDAVRPGEDAFAPGADEIAVAVEHRDRMRAAVEGIDPVMAVDADRGDIAQLDLVRKLCPIGANLEREPAAAELHRHQTLPRLHRHPATA